VNTQSILLFKQETTPGTLEALTGSNVIETVGGINVTPYAGETITRDIDQTEASAGEVVNVNPHQVFAFNVDAAGAGAAGTAPVFGPLLQACGLVETVNAGTDCTYVLSNTATAPTVSLAKYEGDDKLQQGEGALGNVVLSFANKIPQFQFSNFICGYNRPVNAVFPSSLVYDNYSDPLPFTKENTPVAKLNGKDLVLLGGQITFGSGVTMRNVPNQKGAQHGELYATYSLTFEAKSIADENWFESLESHDGITPVDCHIQHGIVDGNIIEFISTKDQITSLSEGEDNDNKTYTLEVNCLVPPSLIIR